MIEYLRNTQKIFKVFVASRVQHITELSNVLRCRYILYKINLADYASRGLTLPSNEQVHVWFNGPKL